MPFHFRNRHVVVSLFCLIGNVVYAGRSDPSVLSLYHNALRLYSTGLYDEALTGFLQVQKMAGPYRQTHTYIARCVKELDTQGKKETIFYVVNQARGLLALRESALKAMTRKGVTHAESDRGSHFFRGATGVFEDGSARDALTAFLSTVPGAWVTIMSSATPDQEISRESLVLAERLVREGGFSSKRLILKSRPGTDPEITISVHLERPKAETEEKDIPGVLVRADRLELTVGSGKEMTFFLFIPNPEKGRRWSLELINEHGTVTRSFGGSTTVLAQVSWDGFENGAQQSLPGRYVARLSVLGWREDLLGTDTVSFSVVKPMVPANSLPSPTEHSLPAQRQHRVIIRFQDDAAVPIQRERDVAARVAYLLAINPNKKVAVSASAGVGEKNPGPLAARRASWVREELLRLGVSNERIRLEEPSGEGGSQVVVVFEESNENLP